MKKKFLLLAALVMLASVALAACSAPAAAPAQPPAAAAPTLAAPPPSEAPAQVIQPTAAGQQVTQQQPVQQAPICQAADTCQALNAEQYGLDCVKKVPYTNVLVPPGTKFEVMDKSGAFVCEDSGMVVNGKQVLTCRGTELLSFQLKLSNAACDGAALPTGTGQCQQGYGYDAAKNCCAPVSGGSGGFAMVTVNLGGCPLPNSSRP